MLPTSELHRHFMTEFQPKFRSIIITDMLHRPAQLLCILSGFYRSMPLRFYSKTGISWRTYLVATHILTSCMLFGIQLSNSFGLPLSESVKNLFRLSDALSKNPPTIPACMRHIF